MSIKHVEGNFASSNLFEISEEDVTVKILWDW